MKALNVAAYGMDAMYSSLAANLPAIQTAGWNSIMLGMFHPHLSGDVWFNNTQILSNGNYIGRPEWASLLQGLTQGPGSGIRLAATVGGAPPWVDGFQQHPEDLPKEQLLCRNCAREEFQRAIQEGSCDSFD